MNERNLRDDFCVLILSHGRAGNIETIETLDRAGYTGDWYIVIDCQEDIEPYEKEYGPEKVIYFDKEDIIDDLDRADNFDTRRGIVYARYNSFKISDFLL